MYSLGGDSLNLSPTSLALFRYHCVEGWFSLKGTNYVHYFGFPAHSGGL